MKISLDGGLQNVNFAKYGKTTRYKAKFPAG